MDKVGRGALVKPGASARCGDADQRPGFDATGPAGRSRRTSPGEWRLDNNEQDTTAQPPLGDYLGIPFNDAEAHALGHHRGVAVGHARNTSADRTRLRISGADLVARRILEGTRSMKPATSASCHIQFMRSLDRPVFMDGHPHPPAHTHRTRGQGSRPAVDRQHAEDRPLISKDGYLSAAVTRPATCGDDRVHPPGTPDTPPSSRPLTIRSTWTSPTSNRRRRCADRRRRWRWRRATPRPSRRTVARTATGCRTSSPDRTPRSASGSRRRSGCIGRADPGWRRPSIQSIGPP